MTNEQLVARIHAGENEAENMLQHDPDPFRHDGEGKKV